MKRLVDLTATPPAVGLPSQGDGVIRIAFVIDTIATPGAGTEKQLLMLLHGLDRTRFEPTLVCLRPSDWLGAQNFPFDVRILNVGPILRPSILGAISRFRKLHREKQFDIVQTFFIDANIFGTLAARAAGVRTVISSRRNIGYWHDGIHPPLLRLLRHWTTHYLANSEAVVDVVERVEHVSRANVTVIYNGLDLDDFRNSDSQARTRQRSAWGIKDDETLVGVVANLRPVKNIPSFICAASLLMLDFPRVRFVVVGDGPERERLEKQIRAKGLDGRFALAGPHADIPSCLAAFDMAVLCSASESFSGALVEYMAAGLPIAASDVGGNREAVTHGETGLLYESDDGANLAAAIRNLLSDPVRSGEMGERARSVAWKRFGSEFCIKHYEAFYEQVLSGVIP